MTDHILIKCPSTKANVRTGYRAPRDSAIDGFRNMRLRRCPRCEQEHHWDGKDGFWSEAVQAPPRSPGLLQLLLGTRAKLGHAG